MRRTDPDFVVGTKPPYKIQPSIVHPRWCVCERCTELTEEQRIRLACRRICCLVRPLEDREIIIRVQRVSPFPASRPKSAAYALALKEELEAQLAAALQYIPATPAPPPAMTLEEISTLYARENPRNVSPETLLREKVSATNVLRVLAIVAPDVPPEEIGEPEAVALRNQRQREGAAARTIGGELSFLKMLLEFGFRWRSQTGMNGVKLTAIPEVGDEQREGVALSVDEFRAILEVITPINRRRFIFGVTTLLRRTPLLALREEWTDLRESWLSVPAAVMKKGRAKKRYPLEVPMSRWAAAQLQGITPWHGYWWPNVKTHEPLTWIDHVLSAARRKIKLTRHGEPVHLRLHDLRTTGITWLRNAGVDEITVAILAGQRSTYDPDSATTRPHGGSVTRSYTRVHDATLREAVAIQDELRRQVERPSVRKVG